MSVIYTPAGKAREYSPLACNLYNGCTHGCLYCYAPSIRRQTKEEYLKVEPRRNILRDFGNDAKKYKGTAQQVLFCFMTDPYNGVEDDLCLTRSALGIALENKIPIAILSKAGNRVLRDLEIFKKFGKSIKVGATLTMDNDIDSLQYEPFAALPQERLDMLKKLHDNGVQTWASFEPVLDPVQSLAMVERSLPFVDKYKVGKINNFRGLDAQIDWTSFLKNAVEILRDAKKPFYIKYDLRKAAPSVKLYATETEADLLTVSAFE